jgi:16S rRNA (cytosine967-C5)-methyltransferase
MTPAARVQAAIEALDRVIAGMPAEQALIQWARGARYAGSGDRAAVRDHVFDGLRQLRSASARAGAAAPTGRAVMIGLLGRNDAEALFSGQGHAPRPLSAEEQASFAAAPPPGEADRLDCPAWLMPRLKAALGVHFEAAMVAAQSRAHVYLRANLRRTPREVVQVRLADEGIVTSVVAHSRTALKAEGNYSKINRSSAFIEGLVELQDLSSQLAVECLPLRDGQRVLDYCAGGGGKSLAMAALADVRLTAHDVASSRMRDIGPRAARAGVGIAVATSESQIGRSGFDLVLVDEPCSGSGTWSRTPDAKWRLTGVRLAELVRVQAEVLGNALAHVRPGGHLAYMTCSWLTEENEAQIARLVAGHTGLSILGQQRFGGTCGGDGFFLSVLAIA